MTAISRAHTSCKDCIFAVYDGKTQTGCDFNNRVEKYREKGLLVDAKDDENEFFIVNRKFCLAKRNYQWLKQQGFDHSTTERLVDAVRDEMSINYAYIVYIDEATDESIEKLHLTLKSVLSNKIKPHEIIVVNNTNGTEFFEHRLVNMITGSVQGTGVKWSLKNIVEQCGRSRALLISVKEVNVRLFLICDVGYEIADSYISRLDTIVNDELRDFVCIVGPDILITNPLLYKTIKGDMNESFVEKIYSIAAEDKESGIDYTVLTTEEL
jgi:hypothetical protein